MVPAANFLPKWGRKTARKSVKALRAAKSSSSATAQPPVATRMPLVHALTGPVGFLEHAPQVATFCLITALTITAVLFHRSMLNMNQALPSHKLHQSICKRALTFCHGLPVGAVRGTPIPRSLRLFDACHLGSVGDEQPLALETLVPHRGPGFWVVVHRTLKGLSRQNKQLLLIPGMTRLLYVSAVDCVRSGAFSPDFPFKVAGDPRITGSLIFLLAPHRLSSLAEVFVLSLSCTNVPAHPWAREPQPLSPGKRWKV